MEELLIKVQELLTRLYTSFLDSRHANLVVLLGIVVLVVVVVVLVVLLLVVVVVMVVVVDCCVKGCPEN